MIARCSRCVVNCVAQRRGLAIGGLFAQGHIASWLLSTSSTLLLRKHRDGCIAPPARINNSASWPTAALLHLHQSRQGFRLQDPEVDDVVRTAKELEVGYVEPDTSLSAEENVELLLRATRLLQLGLEVQYAEGQTLLTENNDLRGDLRVRE